MKVAFIVLKRLVTQYRVCSAFKVTFLNLSSQPSPLFFAALNKPTGSATANIWVEQKNSFGSKGSVIRSTPPRALTLRGAAHFFQ